MTTKRPFTLRRALAALAVGAALTTSACGVDAGAAAIVDGRRISVGDVQTATTQVNRITGDQPIPERDVLSFLVIEPFVVSEAARRGVGVSQDQARQIVRDLGFKDAQTGSTTPDDATVDLVRSLLALQRLQGAAPSGETGLPAAEGQAAVEEITARLKAADISVNPRYGTFEPVVDPAQNKVFPITAESEKWLVRTPSPEPTPSQ